MSTNTQPHLNGILDSNGRRVPLALVIDWNRRSLRILCPYCLHIHNHGVGHPPWSGQTRVSHCHRGGINDFGSRQYQLRYPYESPAKEVYSYEIDKKCRNFVTVGVALPDEEDDELSSDEEAVTSSADDGDDVEGVQEKLSFLAVNDCP
jgi:hypothetical protein